MRKGRLMPYLLNSEFGSWEGLYSREYVNKNRVREEKNEVSKANLVPRP